MTASNESGLQASLYPSETQCIRDQHPMILLEQYKLFVDTSERLVARRQVVNTFFLSVNALLFSVVGICIKEAVTTHLAALGIVPIAIAGIVLCYAWRVLVRSYRQLNRGKFDVIHLLEEHLPACVFKAEWKALGEGKAKQKYKPFTSTEAWIPIVFIVIYVVFTVAAALYLCIPVIFEQPSPDIDKDIGQLQESIGFRTQTAHSVGSGERPQYLCCKACASRSFLNAPRIAPSEPPNMAPTVAPTVPPARFDPYLIKSIMDSDFPSLLSVMIQSLKPHLLLDSQSVLCCERC